MKKNLPLGKLPEHKGVQICLFIFHFVNELVISTILIKTTRCDSLLTRPDDQISFHGVGILAVGIVLRLDFADPKILNKDARKWYRHWAHPKKL